MPLVSKSFSDIITFTRASSGTYFDATGTLQTATTDAARFDYNPSTLAARGFLIEEQRTNSIRNNTMVGAAAGTPGTLPTNWLTVGGGLGTLTQQIVGTGIQNGINYIDIKLSGTTSTTSFGFSFDQHTQIVAATSETWTSSVWLSIISGSTTNITLVGPRVVERTSGGVTVAATTTNAVSILTSTLTRIEATRTLTEATTERVSEDVIFNFSSGVAIDVTLRIGLPQLEKGAFATSVISTSSAAVTRSADVASVNTLSPWYNSTEYTIYYEGMFESIQTATVYTGVGDTFSNTAYFTRAEPNQTFAVLSGGAASAQIDRAVTPSTNVVFKMAGAAKLNDFAFCVNGGTVGTDTSGNMPASAVRLSIGNTPWSAGGGGQKQQWVRRITYYPRRLSNTELQGITT